MAVIDPELQDLLPLYISEGTRRLERLLELAPVIAQGPATAEARRELHTLKGSSRMLKMQDIADLCHTGETLLQEPDETTSGRFTSLLDQLDQFLGQLASSELASSELASSELASSELANRKDDQLDGAADLAVGTKIDTARAEPTGDGTPVEGSDSEGEMLTEYRISTEATDHLTGSMSAIRLLALSGSSNARRLTELAQLAESGVTEPLPRQVLAMLATHLRQVASDLDSGQRRLLHHAEDQLDRLLHLQLQPLRPFIQGLARHARQLARTLGKEIEVELEGGEARLDQRIANELRSAFLHLVANAVDHGIEMPEERVKLGKPRTGRLKITAISHGERIEIAVSDDGGGVDPKRVFEVAVKEGLIETGGRDLTNAEILDLLFTTGFSTRSQVSQVSGRGVGLDAVANIVRQLGGDVWMDSKPGRGSRLVVEVPAARRGETVMVIRCGFDRLAVPKSAVSWLRMAAEGDLVQAADGVVIEADGQLLRVVSLAESLGQGETEQPVLVAIQVAGSTRVLAVEEVEGEEEVLIRPFGRAVAAPDIYSGIALLTSGEPVAVLSPRGLLSRLQLAQPQRRPAPIKERLRVLLVEDSLVTREMERRMLEEEGFHVTTAADAEEGLSRLGQETYDCLVTDLEMPGMSGFELTRHVRNTARWAQLPVIVVSTRGEPADRVAGLEAGADAYISKQTLDAQKLANLIRRLGSRG